MSALKSMFAWAREHPILCLLVVLLIGLLAVFGAVMASGAPEWAYGLFGAKEKFRVLEFLGVAMGGVLLAIGAMIAHKRAAALERAAEAQAGAATAQAAANKGAEDGRRQERLKNAIEHLGHTSDSVRLGGAYELFHLAKDTEDLRQTVLDILCAHIRRTTGEDEYRERHKSKPSEEVQSLLTLLFVQDHEVFRRCDINLRGSCLNGVNLRGARLKNAEMSKVHLREANLDEAYLAGAWLDESDLQGVRLVRAYLPGAYMNEAHLQGANLGASHLRGVSLFYAHLEGANLAGTHMQGANLAGARLQGADLYDANLQGVTSESDCPPYFADHIRESRDQYSDLDSVIFEGGLSKKYVDTLTEILSNEKANHLRWKLESHIDKKVSSKLPEDSNVVTEPYTEKEAEKWIEEYEEVMFGDADRRITEYEEAMRERPEAGEG